MAVFNEILEGRFNRFLQKHLGMKGGPPARSLAGEIFPHLDLSNPGVGQRVHLGWDLFGSGAAQGGVAAQNTIIRFRNPAGSGVLAEILKLAVSSGVAETNGVIATTIGNTDVAAAFANSFLIDQRGSRPAASCIISRANNVAAVGTKIATLELPTINSFVEYILFEDQEFSLSPGSVMDIASSVLNTQWNVNFLWRERLLADSELR